MSAKAMPWIVICILVLIGFLTGIPSPGWSADESSSNRQGRGPAFSGITALANNAETVVMNPAGMTRLKQPSWHAGLTTFYLENSSDLTAENVQGKRTTDDDSTFFLPALYYARPINDRWFVGFGPNAVAGLGASYGDDWIGRYLLDEWSLFFVGVVPSVAYRVNARLSVGASLSLNYSRFNLDKAVFNIEPGAPDGDFSLETDGFAVGYNLGLLYEFTPRTRIGLVYRSELASETEGEPDFSGLSATRRNLLDQAGVLDQTISVETNQPQSIAVGIFHDFGNQWSMTLDVGRLDFSEWNLSNIEIGDMQINTESTEYQDIWAASLGISYAWTPQWTLKAAAAHVSSGVEDEDRTLFLRADEIWGIGVGVEFFFDNRRSLAFDITYFQLGEGKVTVEGAPVTGDLQAEYDENYGIAVSIAYAW